MRELFRAVLLSLASLEGIEYATSGNVLFEDMNALREWAEGGSPRRAG